MRVENSDLLQNSPSNAPRLLVGNKIDKPNRVIDKEPAQNYAESMNVEYFETSAKENKNIDELFVRMTELILKYKNNEEPEEKPVTSMFLHCCLLLICS